MVETGAKVIHTRDTLVRQIRSDPWFQKWLADGQRWIAQHPGHGGHPARTPRAVLGEQRALALATVIGNDIRSDEAAVDLALATLSAVPFLWPEDIRMLAGSYSMPPHVVSEFRTPQTVMFWDFEGAISARFAEYPWVTGIDALLVTRLADGSGLHVVAWANSNRTALAPLCLETTISRGAVFPGDLSDLERAVLTFLAFVNSPFVGFERRVTHESGAKVKWHGRRIGDPLAISVVTLRSEVREAVAVEHGTGPRWKVRWLVRGHYRAQPYPAEGVTRVIWIAPYLKGPEDAPLKVPVYAVVR